MAVDETGAIRKLATPTPTPTPTQPIDPKTGLTAQEANGGLPLPFPKGTKVAIGIGFDEYHGNNLYQHEGIDFRVAPGTRVLAIKGGRVSIYGNDESVLVVVQEVGNDGQANGRVWQYIHIDYTTIPSVVRDAARRGEVIPAGTEVGRVVAFSIGDATVGGKFHHLHLQTVLAPLDKPLAGTSFNIRRALPIPDRVKPSIEAIHFVSDGKNEAVTGEVPVLEGAIDIIVDAYDRSNGLGRARRDNSDPDAAQPALTIPPYKLPVKAIDVEVRPIGRQATVFTAHHERARSLPTWKSSGPDNAANLSSLKVGGAVLEGTGHPEHQKRFLYIATNPAGGSTANGAWDTRQHPDGEYRVTVIATDDFGNQTRSVRTVRINNGDEEDEW